MISLCMITRNEESFLEGCLASARSCADEIVVVDTGSTDRTVEIARRFQAKVFFQTWRDDFSAPRNEALAHARGDWILALDADERLEPGAEEPLRRAAEENSRVGYFLSLWNESEGGRRSVCLLPRFFVNHPRVRYRYVIHEQVLPDLRVLAAETRKPIGTLPAAIRHLGYDARVMENRGKRERNFKLFRKQLRLYPRDAYTWYQYAAFLQSWPGKESESIKAWKEAFRLLQTLPEKKARELPFAGEVAARLGEILFRLGGRKEEALAILRTGAARYSPTPHLFYLKAGIERRLGLIDEARRSYRRCLELDGRGFMVPVAEGITGWRALAGLGSLNLEEGKIEEAMSLYAASLDVQPRQKESFAGMAEALYRGGDPAGAFAWMEKLVALDPASIEAWQAGGDLLEKLGRSKEARAWRERAVVRANQDSL